MIFRKNSIKIFLLHFSSVEKLLPNNVAKAGPETIKHHESYGSIMHKQQAVLRNIVIGVQTVVIKYNLF